jgi:hypothetical protein
MPLLPLLIRTGMSVGLDRYWLGLVIPNLAFVAGLGLFGRCVFRVTEEAATVWHACILLVVFPTSFYPAGGDGGRPRRGRKATAPTAHPTVTRVDSGRSTNRPGRSVGPAVDRAGLGLGIADGREPTITAGRLSGSVCYPKARLS